MTSAHTDCISYIVKELVASFSLATEAYNTLSKIFVNKQF